MEQKQVELILECNEGIRQELEKYCGAAEVILSCQTEQLAEIDAGMTIRKNAVEKISGSKAVLDEILETISEPEKSTIKSMYNNKPLTKRLEGNFLQLQQSITNLRSLQTTAVKLDKQMTEQFASRKIEVMDRLQLIKEGKKKINYYNQKMGNNTKKSGNSLDNTI